MKEMNINELKSINGGESFAYRVGQAIRWLVLSQTPEGCLQFQVEIAVNEALSD